MKQYSITNSIIAIYSCILSIFLKGKELYTQVKYDTLQNMELYNCNILPFMEHFSKDRHSILKFV